LPIGLLKASSKVKVSVAWVVPLAVRVWVLLVNVDVVVLAGPGTNVKLAGDDVTPPLDTVTLSTCSVPDVAVVAYMPSERVVPMAATIGVFVPETAKVTAALGTGWFCASVTATV